MFVLISVKFYGYWLFLFFVIAILVNLLALLIFIFRTVDTIIVISRNCYYNYHYLLFCFTMVQVLCVNDLGERIKEKQYRLFVCLLIWQSLGIVFPTNVHCISLMDLQELHKEEMFHKLLSILCTPCRAADWNIPFCFYLVSLCFLLALTQGRGFFIGHYHRSVGALRFLPGTFVSRVRSFVSIHRPLIHQ